jgi:hypothetical protein
LLQPFPIPKWKWGVVSIDLITKLSKIVKKHDSIIVVVDKLNKATCFIPVNLNHKENNIANVYMREISKLHGVPKKIVFDRDPKFTSNLWKGLFKRFGKFFIFSTSYLIKMDIGGHPPIPTGSHVVFIIGSYFLDF